MSSTGTDRPAPVALRLGVRGRLLLAAVAMLATTLSAAFLWARHQLSEVLFGQLDRQLVQKAQELAAVAARAGPESQLEEEIEREIEVYREDGFAVAVRRSGRPELTYPPGPAGIAAAALAAEEGGGLPRDLPGPGGAAWRGVRIAAGELAIGVAMSPARVRNTLALFDSRVAWHGLAFLLLALPGGLLLHRLALRPVVAAVAAARSIAPDDPHARLPRNGANDEFDALAATVNELLERVAAHQGQVRRITADAAHELRTPLAIVRAAAEVALQQPRGADHYREVLEGIVEQAERLSAIVESLQLLARGDAGELRLERRELDAAALCAELAELFEPMAQERGVALRLAAPKPVPLLADAARLRQALTNLLDNALKFTPAGGTVTLSAAGLGEAVRFEVADTGIGISPAALPQVFERFFRAEEARGRAGSGLGLSIVRTIVAAHGGTVAALPGGLGATFRVTLPGLAKRPPVVRAPPASAAGV